ncbi:DUF2254 domain-containing protein [Chromobacterium alticapitis]|uniref:DUF2254 domain-containing protein n=1 Tax=Chromobacterium alticapitis TaxID=2073169 RepID=A0A2S5DK70_9NEIS|nr:DUF2254 domain-containing protein [Chromobacterium alticapitis]POZ63421.1 DUF2254 domain-containing protein [Chromobacterium alticapitis]
MTRHLPRAIQHILFNLRGGFLVRPLIISLGLGLLGGWLSWLEEKHPAISAWLPAVLFPSREDPQVAQVMLSAIATSIMTVVSIVFAILLMSLTLASMQFSPRIIVSFSRDKVTQWTLGIFLGTFAYCIAALPAARLKPYAFSPVLTVFGSMLLAVACVVGLLFFIHHISRAISVNYIVDRIAEETEQTIADQMPEPHAEHLWESGAAPNAAQPDTPILNRHAGYIRYMDTRKLVQLAKAHQIKLCVARRVGQFAPAAAPLFYASRGERLTPKLCQALQAAIDIGPSRTLQQDVEFGVLQIVDIALKAISPAVNDPTTAITCIDQLSRILCLYSQRSTPQSHYYDPPGVVRVAIPVIETEALLESAFEHIRHYARGDMAVSLRLLAALNDIAAVAPGAAFRLCLLAMGQRTVDACREHLDEQAMRRLRARLDTLQAATRC